VAPDCCVRWMMAVLRRSPPLGGVVTGLSPATVRDMPAAPARPPAQRCPACSRTRARHRS
jgi:hypothetical protein